MELQSSNRRQAEYDRRSDSDILPSEYHPPATDVMGYINQKTQMEPELHKRNKQGGGQ